MMNVDIDYPSESEELEIVLRTTSPSNLEFDRVLSVEEILALQELVLRECLLQKRSENTPFNSHV